MKYIVTYGRELSGLTPSFAAFKRLDTMADVVPQPAIVEIPGTGSYVFDYDPAVSDPDIFFQVDGGAVLAESIRYQVGVISPSDVFLDKKITDLDTAIAAVDAKVTDVVPTLQGGNEVTLSDLADTLGPRPGGEGQSTVFQEIGNLQTSCTDVAAVLSATGAVVDGIAERQGLPNDSPQAETEFGRMAAILDQGGGSGGSGNVGAPTDAPGAATLFGKLYETRDQIKAKTDLIPGDFSVRMDELKNNVVRLLGLSKENSVLDQTVFDPKNNLTSGRLRIFASKADAVNGVNPVAVYTITATYVAGTTNIQTYSMVRDS